MTVNFYKNHSEPFVVNKEITLVNSYDGVSRTAINVENPSLLFNLSNSDNIISTIENCNYAFISEFERYYYIETRTPQSNALLQVTFKCDVLSSFKEQLLQQTAIIKRQENLWNLYLSDFNFKTYQNPKIQLKKFPQGFDVPNTFTWVLVTSK